MSSPVIVELKTIISDTDKKYRDGLVDITKVLVTLSAAMIAVIATLAPKSDAITSPDCIPLLAASLVLLSLSLLVGLCYLYQAVYVYRIAQKKVAVIIQETPDPQKALEQVRIVKIEYGLLYRTSFPICAGLFVISLLSLITYSILSL